MNMIKRTFCLFLCLLLLSVPALAADSFALPEEFFSRYDGLFDDVVGTLQSPTENGTEDAAPSLSERLEKYDLSHLGADLKTLLNETEQLSDAELDTAIRLLAASHNISLVDSQVQQLCDLCRTLEKLSPEEIQEKVDDLRKGVEKLEQGKEKLEQGKEILEQGKEKLEKGKEKLEQFKEKHPGFFGWLKGLFQKLVEFLKKLLRLTEQE